MMKPSLLICLLLVAGAAQAQYKCVVGGRTVMQPEPCADPANYGKYRCFVDGEVVYSEVSCAKVKSKEALAREAKAADDADNAKRRIEAGRLEAADRPNFARRILLAQQHTARHLRDPSSARFDGAFVSWFSGHAVVCGLVAGRNGFGGYAQPVRFVTWDEWVTLDDSRAITGFEKHWDKYCGPR
jgi:hypothetical protein